MSKHITIKLTKDQLIQVCQSLSNTIVDLPPELRTEQQEWNNAFIKRTLKSIYRQENEQRFGRLVQ